MADELSVALLDLLRKSDGAEAGAFIREAMRKMAQAVIEAELEMMIGAGRCQRADSRTNHRNGTTPRASDTTAGTLELAIRKLRKGPFSRRS